METNSRVELKQEEENYSKGLLKIRDKIRDPQIKVVSFDVFDTLLFRPVLTPVDIFRLLENKLDIPNFHNMRVTAEAEARRYKSIYVQDITLEEIYKTYAHLFGLTEGESKALMQEELDIEYTLLYARKSAKYLYQQALEAGKEIIIISDMYLPGDFIDTVLKKNGYEGYTHIYVSSETGVLKSSKLMFKQVLSELAQKGIEPSEVIHIGDNKKSDVDCAIATGINAMWLPKPAEIRNSCKQLKRVYDYILQDAINSNNALLYGVLINLYFDDPFVNFEKASFFNGEAKLMGYWFAPFMIGFTKWMIECIEEENIEQLLLVWRDGYLPQKLLQILRPLCTNRHLDVETIYLGRALQMHYLALDQNGFFSSFAYYPLNPDITVNYFIRERLLCEDEEQHKEILNIFFNHGYMNGDTPIGRFEKYRGFLYELEPYFIENAKKKIGCYSKYIYSKVDRNSKVAVFDRSLRGKSSSFLKQYFDINYCSITTEIFDTPKAKLKDINMPVYAYLEYGLNCVNRMGRIWAMLFERIISDTSPGFRDIVEKEDGSFEVILDSVPTDEIDSNADVVIREVQNAIVVFAEQVALIFGEYFPYVVIDRHGVFDYVIDVLSVPHKKDADLILKINPDKSTIVPINGNAFVNWYNRKIRKTTKEIIKKKTPWDYIRHAGYVTAEKLGILLPARTLYRNIIGDPLEPVISVEKLQEVTDRHIEYIKELDCKKIDALFLGSVPQETAVYFNKLSQIEGNLHFLFVACGFIRFPTWTDFPCIAGPDIFSFWRVEGQELKIKVPDGIRNAVKEKTYLRDLVQRRVLRGYSESVATVLAYETERYYTALIDKIDPKLVMLWNNWGYNSVVPGEIAKRRGISVVSAERGFLEGTMMFSTDGYGRDLINTNPAKFSSLMVSTEELTRAQETIDFLQSTGGFNRYNQAIHDGLESLRHKLDNGKKNIFIAGCFDCENPAFPKNEEYSPTFATSREAMLHIAKLAKRNDWNVIYKAHPLMNAMDKSHTKNKIPSNVIHVKDIDINGVIDLADVVICMISGVAYTTLTRGKPLVELAYTPLKGKGCCYEPKNISDIEASIKDAIKNGYTNEQKKSFVKHIAQVCKYYFFDDLNIRPIRYGRSIEEAGALLDKLIEEQKEKQKYQRRGKSANCE